MQQLKGSFTAYDDTGTKYPIRIVVDVRRETTLDGSTEIVEGLPSLLLDNGHHVNHVAKGEYLVVQTQTRLRSDDPEAP